MAALRLLLAAACLSVLTCGAAEASSPLQSFRNAERLAGPLIFESATPPGLFPPGREELRAAPRARVGADLALPRGPGPFPAMVLLHGSSGAGPRDRVWAKWLTDQGVACLIVDSFSLRHVPETVTDQFRLPVWTGAFDALAALALLSTHPKIDPRRIGVMGFSRGGMSALQTALEPVRAAALPALGQIRFAGHAAFYPFCGARAVVGGEKSVSGAPVLFLLGQEDDYAPPAPCRAYARWFEKSGAPTRVIEYPRAPHGFDFPGRRARIESAVILAPECAGELELTGRTYRPDDPAKAFREWRPLGPAGNLVPAAQFPEFLNRCLRRGATVGGDKETGEAVRTDLLAWMREVGILK